MILYECKRCEATFSESLMKAECYVDEDDNIVCQTLICPRCDNDTFSVHMDNTVEYESNSSYLM